MSSRQEQSDAMAAYVSDKISPVIKTALRNATKCCPNCEHFTSSPLEKCKLNNARPPATVIAFGCELFLDNEVPF
jgi:hypothetical protein